MSPDVERMTKHLHALQDFMDGPAYVGFVAARKDEIVAVKNRILTFRPDSEVNIALQNQAHGELDCLDEMVETFENAVIALKARISETTERENTNDTTTKL